MQIEPDHALISSERVEGTDVLGPDGERVGIIHHLMIDKVSGRIAYAVMSFGGFLGMGEDHHPVPWSSLRYDTELRGYVTGITREQLEGAPRRNDDWQGNRRWEEEVYSYYGVPYYWI